MKRSLMMVMMMALIAGQAYADRIVEIQGADVTDDAYVSSFQADTTYNGGVFELRNYQTTARQWGVVKFDLPVLNPGEYISDAAMTFDYFGNYNTTAGSMTVNLHRLLYSWIDSQVTWNSRMTGTAWTSGNLGYGPPPANYAVTSLGSTTLTVGQFGLKTFQSADLAAVLDQMARGLVANNGFVLRPNPESGGPNNRFHLASSDRADQVKPKLTLTISTAPITGRTVEIQGSDVTVDAYVDTYNDNNNYNNTSYRLKNYSTSQTIWGLVKFNLPILSEGEYISNAAVTFDYFANDNSNAGTITVDLKRLVYSWEESQVTWNSRMTGIAWTDGNIGYANEYCPSNYSPTSLGNVSLTVGEFGLKTFQSPELASAIDQMARGAFGNFGFLLSTGRNYGTVNNSFYFASSEREDQVKPKLTLTIATKEAEQKPYPLGWYDAISNQNSPTEIAAEGGNIILPYSNGTVDATLTYLDSANALGLKVILPLSSWYISNQNTAGLRSYVSTFDAHPAVYGWYLADEPVGKLSAADCEIAYNAVKLESSKPVFACFMGVDVDSGATIAYANAYDVLMVDVYTINNTTSEFQGLDAWKTKMQTVNSQAQTLGKIWWPVVQGYGQQSDQPTWDKRLPTYGENKFMMYWPVLNDGKGVLSWAHYRAIASLANASHPYTGNGAAWIEDVWSSVAAEFAQHGKAVAAGALVNGVSDDQADILSGVYMDSETDEYYLIALNNTAGSKTANFTLSLPAGLNQAVRVGETGSGRTIVNGVFSDTFTSYQVHVYKLTAAAALHPGDANGDGMVDVGDLGILAANYGGSGKTWAQGDFNGDGLVDVGDLGILAANYGFGVNATLDFNADAKALGLTVGDEEITEDATDELSCGLLGMPLVAMLFLAGCLLAVSRKLTE